MIAATILQQIGGRRFAAMTGSRDFMDLGDGVRMNLSRNKTSANRLTITLDEETDTYRMRFYRMMVGKHFEVRTKDIAVYEGVYCDMLEEVFTWGVASLKEWIDNYESSRFTQTDERMAVITSEYNMTHVKAWLERNTPIDRLVSA